MPIARVPEPDEVPKYDWLSELGAVPDIVAHGISMATHPLRRALIIGGACEQRARRVLMRAIELAEGRTNIVAAILSCHYITAFRLIHNYGLEAEAGAMRFQSRRSGAPTMVAGKSKTSHKVKRKRSE